MTNHYIVHLLKTGTELLLTYKDGRFYQLRRKKGTLTGSLLSKIGVIIPETESEISEYRESWTGSVTYEKKESGPQSIYQQFVTVWLDFYTRQKGFAPRFNAIEGKNLKGVIRYLADIGGSEEEALVIFRQILSNYHQLDEFHQRNFDLKYINGNITRIISNVKQNTKGKTTLSEDFKKRLADRLRS